MVLAELRHPIVRSVAAYWEQKRGLRPMPARADLDPCEIPSLLPHVLLLDVSHDPLDFRYRLVGTVVDYHLGGARTGQWLSRFAQQAPGSAVWAPLETAVATRRPVAGSAPYAGPHPGFARAEDIVLPLSVDGERVTMLLVAIAYVRTEEPMRAVAVAAGGT